MPNITLPDKSQRNFSHPISVHEVAASIGAGLAKAALAGKVNDKLVDTSYVIENDCNLSIITEKDEVALEVIRHSTAHLVAQAAQQLFPELQVTIGPVIEDGFYYDFAFTRAFTPEDLTAIEKRMTEIVKQDLPIKRIEMPRDQAIKFFRDRGEEYKAKIIEDIPANETLSLYEQGEFTDLCRGPHVPSTGKLKVFKLLKVAGAYWRGDSKNEMLQRIYGTAWANKDQLAAYLMRLEEAEKRDHRKIAKQLDLFHQQEEAPGMVFWHPNGWIIYREVENYIRKLIGQCGYVEVKTPQVIDRKLWERSGHWQNYRDDMFVTESEERTYVLKPMSCPAHIEIFNQGIKSYRDLPLRMAEFGSCHRNEASGALHGLMRVRNFVQDDAHIFCTEEQVKSESFAFIKLAMQTYKDFGFDDVIILLSTRPAKRIGDDAFWDKTEKFLEDALNETGLPWKISPGDGAFYAPKIDFSLRDCIGRVWQVGTLQLDYNLPSRLGAEYIAQDGSRQMPVMLHRAIIGSVERFVGILIEQYAGKLPLWLAPQQAVVMNITDRQAEYAIKMTEILKNQGVRAKSDLRNEKISFKIREHTLQRIPYLLTVGEREMESGTASIRTQSGEDLGVLSIEKLCERLLNEIKQRSSLNV